MTMPMPSVKSLDIDVDDVEDIRHGHNRLLARVHKPRGR
jgi:hypothetical protein